MLDIFRRLKDDPDIRKKFNFVDLQFSVNHRRLKQQSEIDLSGSDEDSSEEVQQRPRRTGPNKRLATKRKVETSSTHPDGWDIRIYPGGEYVAFIYDYKAAHKLKVEDLEPALANKKLFMEEAINRTCSNKVPSDTELNERDAADTRIAMVLTQAFDHMVTHGGCVWLRYVRQFLGFSLYQAGGFANLVLSSLRTRRAGRWRKWYR